MNGSLGILTWGCITELSSPSPAPASRSTEGRQRGERDWVVRRRPAAKNAEECPSVTLGNALFTL